MFTNCAPFRSAKHIFSFRLKFSCDASKYFFLAQSVDFGSLYWFGLKWLLYHEQNDTNSVVTPNSVVTRLGTFSYFKSTNFSLYYI